MTDYIGKSQPRFDAAEKVTGKALFPGDIDMPDQVFMKILFSGVAHAVVKKIDTFKAEQVPGVLAVLTAKDVPVNEYGLGIKDQPVLCGPGSSKPYTDRVRFIGDQVALVIAESEEIAKKARDLIEVVYEPLPAIFDPELAMEDDTVLVHPDRESNILCRYRIRKGDVDEGFKNADVIIEGDYHTPAQEHAYLQPEAGLSYIDREGRVTVVVAGQWVHEDQEQISHALNLPMDKIRVIYPAIGGAFGGREDMSVQIVLALAAWKLSQKGINRPVKIIWSREESIIGHHKRHPFHITTRWGAKKDGTLVAAEVKLIADGGAYTYTSPKVIGNATLMCTGPYVIPNVKVDSFGVFTNHIPTGAFRGFGGPQGAFAAESQMNKLAEVLEMDPVEIRMRNLLHQGDLLSVGTPLPPGVSIEAVLEKCAIAAGWKKSSTGWHRPGGFSWKDETNSAMHKGIGIACSFKNVGFSYGFVDKCWASIELIGDTQIEKAILFHAGVDVGQGAHTVFRQMAAQSLGIEIEKVHLVVMDTAYAQSSGSVSASRMTFVAGNAIQGAAAEALKKWRNEERPAVGEFTYIPPATTPYDPETGKSEPNYAYGYVAEAVEVAVDIETGMVNIERVYCADDVGKAINPTLVQGQIEGAVVQALGYTILENFIENDDRVLTKNFSTYLIPTILDIPEKVDSLIIEHNDPRGPWGARGMGEMPFLPFAPATIHAMKNAINKWFSEFPLTPDRILKEINN